MSFDPREPGSIAVLALIVAMGARDDEIDEMAGELRTKVIPEDRSAAVRQVREVLQGVRERRRREERQ